MNAFLAEGIRQRPQHAVAGPSATVWEIGITNPASAPDYCSPVVAWLMTPDETGRVEQLRLVHPRPEPIPRPDLRHGHAHDD